MNIACRSAPDALVAVCVLKANVASEVWVADIPDDLPYAATSTWVNFRSGFLLAETIAPGSSRHEFQTIAQPGGEHFRASGNDIKQQALVAAAKLGPTVQWAQANGLIASRSSGHSRDELTQAVTALEQHEYEMFNTIQNLKLKLPSRWRFVSDMEYDKAFRDALEMPATQDLNPVTACAPGQCDPGCGSGRDHRVFIKALDKVPIEYETKAKTDAVRYRTGFILRIAKPRSPLHAIYIEVFPFAGLLRRRKDLQSLPLNGKVVELRDAMSWDKYRLATEVPFDQEAYRENKAPRPGKKAELIVEQVGETLPGIDAGPRIPSFAPNTLYAPRSETWQA